MAENERMKPKRKKPTKADTAGIQNFEGVKLPQTDSPNIMTDLLRVYNHSSSKLSKSEWTREMVQTEVNNFFAEIQGTSIKPTKTALATWLGISTDTYWKWETGQGHCGWTDVIKFANQIMEMFLQADLDKHTIAAMFLLKCKYGYVEGTKLDITTDGRSFATDAAEVRESVKKLGL